MLRTILALCLISPLVATSAMADPIDVLPADLWNNYSTSAPGTPAETDEQVAATDVEDEACAAYGAGYKPVPGSTTCVKVGGHLQMDVYTGRGHHMRD